MSENKNITVTLAAELIGVTSDTLYNWQKQNLLQIKKSDSGDLISQSDVNKIREQLLDGTLDKLNKRANRKFLSGSAIPTALAGKPAAKRKIGPFDS